MTRRHPLSGVPELSKPRDAEKYVQCSYLYPALKKVAPMTADLFLLFEGRYVEELIAGKPLKFLGREALKRLLSIVEENREHMMNAFPGVGYYVEWGSMLERELLRARVLLTERTSPLSFKFKEEIIESARP